MALFVALLSVLYSLIDSKTKEEYFVEVVHSVLPLLSAVIVRDKSRRLLAMSHLINNNALPRLSQVENVSTVVI